MKYYYSLSLLVSLFATIFLFPALANVESLCKDIAKADPENVRYDFCVSEMKGFYITENKTAPQLGALSFTITIVEIDSIVNRIRLILKGAQKLNQSTIIALRDCLDIYSGIVADLLEGGNALRDGDVGAAKNKAGAALKAADTSL